MRLLAALTSLLALTTSAYAGVSSLDYLVDGAKYLDQWTTIDRCNLHNTNASLLVCYVYSKSGSAMSVGEIWIDGETLDREDLRRALNDCAGAGVVAVCWVNISGVPSKGYPGGKNSPHLVNAQIQWLPN